MQLFLISVGLLTDLFVSLRLAAIEEFVNFEIRFDSRREVRRRRNGKSTIRFSFGTYERLVCIFIRFRSRHLTLGSIDSRFILDFESTLDD